MNILLAEDETGIREGLATLLRLKGYVVRAAGSCAEACRLVAAESFDVIVTDWRLGDGLGGQVVEGTSCPVVVMTGYPEEVSDLGQRATVLCKPVSPAALLAEVEGAFAGAATCGSRRAPRSGRDRPAGGLDVGDLPSDTRERIELVWALTGCDAGARLLDDGDIVTLQTALGHDTDSLLDELDHLGGDLRVLDRDGDRRLELRLYRDGRPDGATVVGPGEPWPDGTGPLAVDLDPAGRGACDLDTFVALAERAARETASGRTVAMLNIPPHLRLHLEITGRGHLLPKRPRSGPRLPEVLMELWSQA